MRRSDNSGIKESCPLIDNVISFIKDNVTEIHIDSIISDLEEIRQINKDLRKWGNEKYEALSDIFSIVNNNT